MARFAAVLFDFDGTLADSYTAITKSVNHVRAYHQLPPLAETVIRYGVGHGLLELMAKVVPGGNPEEDAARYREHHPSVMYQFTKLLPGAKELLDNLHGNGIKLGVCSNKPTIFTRKLLEGLHISSMFDVVYGPEDSGKAKPDPQMLYDAMTRLGVTSSETLYIGDMQVDIDTGRAAGVPVWVVPTGSQDAASLLAGNPERLFADLNEILQELR